MEDFNVDSSVPPTEPLTAEKSSAETAPPASEAVPPAVEDAVTEEGEPKEEPLKPFKSASQLQAEHEEEQAARDELLESENPASGRLWYILKVQNNREKSIREAILQRIKLEGLGEFFGDLVIPTEKVTEFRGGKKRVVTKKLFPGYIVVHMEQNERTWAIVRETSGVGDFAGAIGEPAPLSEEEIDRILGTKKEGVAEPKIKIGVSVGANIRIKEGNFENFEGIVDAIDETSGRISVIINIFGRSTPVEIEHWQVESQ